MPAKMEAVADPEVARRSGRLRTGGSRVLVLNASYEPINVCTVRRATVLLLKSRAELLERGEGAIHSERLAIDRPCVIRLQRYVRIPRDVHRRKITRKAVLARDAYTCQYCGREATSLTVDHVIPRSRGGESVWENIVASCAPCNRKKGNRLPREASMHPATRPRPPGPTVFIRIASPRIPLAWERYLAPRRRAAAAAA
jgi:5-methylcytosine-specific restriction endonuclease McrA